MKTISNHHQTYHTIDDDAVIQYVSTYSATARLEVLQLMGEGKFMVTEDWDSQRFGRGFLKQPCC